MSAQSSPLPRLTVPALLARKGGEPIVALTASTAPFARLLDGIADILLVGDSLGMVLYGMESTLPVTLDMMIRHGRTVVECSKRSLVIIDMPFGSTQESPQQAFRNAARTLAETGAQAIKLEGGSEMAETVAFLVQRGIPVMGHIGLMPQHLQTMGGYKIQGRNDAQEAKLRHDATALAQAGAFAMVIEGVVEPLAREITALIPALTIGIGASAACDGQVLVTEDLLGLTPRQPKFVKTYAALAETITQSVTAYAEEVKSRQFPGAAQVYQ